VLLLITFLRRDLAAFALLVLMWLSAIVLVKCSPFINWLTNMAHYGTDFLVLIILLVGLVSVVVDASEGVDGLSMLVIICLTFVLAAITTLIVIEVLSTIVLPQSKLHSVWARESFRKTQVPNLYQLSAKLSAKLTRWSSIRKTQKKAAAAKAMHDDAADVPTAIATNSSVPWVRCAQSGFAPDVGPHCSCNSNGCAHAADITLRIDDKKTMNLEHSTSTMTARPPADAIDYCEGAIRVMHPIRGGGCVVKVDSKDPRGRPVHVMFDKGEFHQYTLESARAKLNLLRPIHLVFDNGEVHHYKFAAAKLEQVEQCSQFGPSADLATGGPHGGDVSVKIKWQHGTSGLNAAELVLSPREGTTGPQATPLSHLDSDYQPFD